MVSNFLPTWKQRRSKQSFVCIHHVTSLCQIRKVSTHVGSSEPGKLDGPFIKCCSLLWTERACHQMLLHAKFPPHSKTTPPCLQTWHPRSEPSARKLSPDRAKIRLQQAGPRNKTKRVLGAQKWGQAFLPDFNCWANWWTQFWVQISTPKMGPQYVKKGTSLLFEDFQIAARSLA